MEINDIDRVVSNYLQENPSSYRNGFLAPRIVFTHLYDSMNRFHEYLHIEELYDVLVENYYELELELLKISSRFMISLDFSYHTLRNWRNIIGRRLINVTSASRMYLDQTEKHLKKIFGETSQETLRFSHTRTQQFENLIGYRTLESLRNYSQHRGFPIGFASFSAELDKSRGNGYINFRCIPYLLFNELNQDNKLSKKLLNELATINEEGNIDLRPLLREYIYGLSNVHYEVRQSTESISITLKSLLQKTINELSQSKDFESPQSVTFFPNDLDSPYEEKIFLSQNLFIRLESLVKKNKTPNFVQNTYTSNQIWDDD